MAHRDAAPRDLLFGLLALQNGMVTRDQLVAAFGAWTASARPLADLLAEHGALDAGHRPLLDALADAHLKLHGGDPEKSLAALEVNRSTRESLARAGGPGVEATLGRVGSGSTEEGDGDGRDRTVTYAVGSVTGDGQRFRVLRPHARGGLGAVFVALDSELHREVALKQILDHHADDPTSRNRFLLEAEITGGLEHPGIVPVYGLGTYGGGRPYYAMRFVRGESLKEAIAAFHAVASLKADPGKRSLALRKLLRRFVDVCNAIDYAHTRGVLHRDIKPANVIVGKHGETLMVDWGLAKLMGRAERGPTSDERTLMPSSASGSAETLPGSALGTPAYMSPEQASGDLDRIGARSDVYSLGATLYCLLTGKTPFEGDDVAAVLRAVQKGDFSPPRALDQTIDRALEAVCLKAMTLKSEDRYATPKGLADDVERWAADEPVSAWREPLARRARRWAKRNRTTVTAAGVALVAGVVGLSAVLVVQTRAKADIARALTNETKANVALANANAELTRSKAAVVARYDLAVDAIKTFHTGVSEDFLLKEDQFKELRDRLLNSAGDFYEKLGTLLKGDADLPSRRALLQANFEVADLAIKVGRKEDALALHRRVLAGREALAASRGADPATAVDVARSLVAVGSVLEETGKTEEALASYEKARSAVAGADGHAPSGAAARSAFAAAGYQAGSLLRTTGHTTEARRRMEQARDLQAALAAAAPKDNDRQSALARSLLGIGHLLSEAGKPAEALASYEAARAILRKLAKANPAVNKFQTDLARSHNNIGALRGGTGKRAEALAAYEAARAIQQKLAEANPAVADFQNELAASHHNIGGELSVAGKPAEALASYQAARAIQQKLAEANPAVTRFQSNLSRFHIAIGALLGETEKPAEAMASYEAALAISQKLAEANPAVTQFQTDLVRSHLGIGLLRRVTGKPAEALASFQAARAISQKLAKANPAVNKFQTDLARIHNNIGFVLSVTGKPAEELASQQEALVIQQRLAEANPAVTEFQNDLARTHDEIGKVLNEMGKPTEELAAREAARAIWQKLAEANPAVTQFQFDLAYGYRITGDLLNEKGKSSEAMESYRRELAIRQKLADDNPDIPYFRSSVGWSLANLGDAQTKLGRLTEAMTLYEQSGEIHRGLVKAHPGVTVYPDGLAHSLSGLGRAQGRDGRAAEAVASLREAIALRDRLPTLAPDVRYHLACNHALLAALATAPGSGLSAAEGRDEAERAMTALRAAVAAGYGDVGRLRTDPDLDPLRDRPDFRLLMTDLAVPADPFAR